MKVLFISSNLIGDSILSTGILSYIVQNDKNTNITIVTGPTAGQLFVNYPQINRIIIMKKRKFSFHWIILWLKILFYKWDLVIDLRSSFISYLIFTKERKIFRKNDKPIPQFEKLSNFIGSKTILLPKIWIGSNDKKLAESITNQNQIIAIAPGGNWNPKIWPIENFNQLIIEIINRYNSRKLKFLIVGSKIEEDIYFNQLVKNIPNDLIINLMNKSLTLTYGCLTYSKVFIGNDSGLMHLAAATGINTIGLFGPTRDDWYRPYGENCHVIRTKESYNELINKLKDYNKSLMISINVNDVIELIEDKKLIE